MQNPSPNFAHLGALLAIALLATACQRVSPAEQAAQDARDVAAVEAAQTIKPPVQPIDPQPMPGDVRSLYKLVKAGCEFRADLRAGAEPVLIAGGAKAVLLINGEPAIFAADSGSAEIAAGVREKYVGRTHWARITHAPDSLTLRDRFERIVYQAAGTLTCHGQPGVSSPG